ncbi:HAMP domain-containing protein [Escherichia coli]
MIVQPLAIIGSHFDSIAAGNLARPIAVYGRNEITAIFASLKTMQQALRGTVSDVHKGSRRCTLVVAEIVAGNNNLSSHSNSRRHRSHKRPPSRRLTATVGQNADNARTASGTGEKMPRQRRRRAAAGQYHDSHHAGIAASFAKNWRHYQRYRRNCFPQSLALNAAVEAGSRRRAGAWFAVAAGEVRNLASRSAQAAKRDSKG